MPNDGYVYEIDITGEVRVTSTHALGVIASVAFVSDIQLSDNRLCCVTKVNQNYDAWASGTMTMLVGKGRFISLVKTNFWNGQLSYLWINKYRKLYKA